MLKKLTTLIRQRVLASRIPEGGIGIRLVGHRNYVGGMWDEIGQLQFDFIRAQGLEPSDCFLDVACGALRGGRFFIDFLDAENYLGIDKESKLVSIGLEDELTQKQRDEKRPEIVISDSFEFSKLSKKPKVALALSLFTHLSPEDIRRCLTNLYEFMPDGGEFYATFFEGDSNTNGQRSHSLNHMEYSREEMIEFGVGARWQSIYIGGWNHPRDQKMMLYSRCM